MRRTRVKESLNAGNDQNGSRMDRHRQFPASASNAFGGRDMYLDIDLALIRRNGGFERF
jgi:hypothetical protein